MRGRGEPRKKTLVSCYKLGRGKEKTGKKKKTPRGDIEGKTFKEKKEKETSRERKCCS